MSKSVWWPKPGDRLRATDDCKYHFSIGRILTVVDVDKAKGIISVSGCGCGDNPCRGWSWLVDNNGEDGWFLGFEPLEEQITKEEAAMAKPLPSAEEALEFMRRGR